MRAKSGGYLTVETWIVPLTEGGVFGGVLSLTRDVTERNQLRDAVRALSTPILELEPRLLLLPLIGTVDVRRGRQVRESLLERIRRVRAKVVIVDVTGVAVVDAEAIGHLTATIQQVKLMGAHVILTGVTGVLSEALV